MALAPSSTHSSRTASGSFIFTGDERALGPVSVLLSLSALEIDVSLRQAHAENLSEREKKKRSAGGRGGWFGRREAQARLCLQASTNSIFIAAKTWARSAQE